MIKHLDIYDYTEICQLCTIHLHNVGKDYVINVTLYNLHITFLQRRQKMYLQLLSCVKT